MRRAGGRRPAGGVGAGPARGPCFSLARRPPGAGRERAGQRGKGRMGRGLSTPHLAVAAGVCSSLALGVRGGAGSCGLATHPAVPSLAALGVLLGFGVGRASREFSRVNTARAAWPGWREVSADSTARRKDVNRAGEEGASSERGRFRRPRLTPASRPHRLQALAAGRGALPVPSHFAPAISNSHSSGRELL